MNDNLKNLEEKTDSLLIKLANSPYTAGIVVLILVAALLWLAL